MALLALPTVSLRVRQRGATEPVIFARFRVDGAQSEPVVGPGWLVRAGSDDAKPRGKAIGGWVDRRGRAPTGFLTVDAAWQAVPEVVAKHQRNLEKEAARRADATVPDLRDAVERWLAARKVDDPSGEWEAWKHSHAKNMTAYAHRMVRELGPERYVDTFRTDDLRKWLTDGLKPMRNGKVLDRPTSRKMRATYSQVLAGFFQFAVAQGWMDEDPTAELPAYRVRKKRAGDPLRREEYLTKAELRSALTALRGGAASVERRGRRRTATELEQDAVMIMVMAMAGLRPGEAIALLWENIDFEAKVIRVVDSRTMGVTDTPKSGSGRAVPMSDELARALRTLGRRGYLVGPTDRVFAGRDGGHVDKDALADRFAAAQTEAGISPPRELRQMRNTFGTVCAAEGVPLRTLQEWMGHASITTTEIYASFMPRDEDAARIEAAFAA